MFFEVARRKALFLLFIFFSVSALFLPFAGSVHILFADGVTTLFNEFDFVDVLSDLEGSTGLDGESFDIADYPYDEFGSPVVINFVEYAYSYKAGLRGNYGLYLYIYNPQGLLFSEVINYNRVQLAVSYGSDGNPIEFDKFALIFCSKSDGVYSNLFYKFRIADKVGSDGRRIVDRVNSIKRRYDVSGVELADQGGQNVIEYRVGCVFTFEGYAEGYGVSVYDKSTLQCRNSQRMETVSLDVRSAYYRTATSDKGRGFQNQLNSVYFGVPDRFFDNYGEIVAVLAEWYEYLLKPFLITTNLGLYLDRSAYIGKHLYEGYIGPLSNNGYWPGLSGYKGIANEGVSMCFEAGIGYGDSVIDYRTLFLSSFMYSSGFNVEAGEIERYILEYGASHLAGYLDVPNKEISADLFYDGVWGGRTVGYNRVSIGKDMRYDLLPYEGGNWLDNALSYGLFNSLGWFGRGVDFGGLEQLSPIYRVRASDMVGTPSEICSRLKLDVSCYAAFKAYYDECLVTGKSVMLFRYAVTPYFSWDIEWFEVRPVVPHRIKDESYVFISSVFLNFDVISLTFNKGDVYRVIPAVSSPIDIFPAASPPVDVRVTTGSWGFLLVIGGLIVIGVGAVLVIGVLKR